MRPQLSGFPDCVQTIRRFTADEAQAALDESFAHKSSEVIVIVDDEDAFRSRGSVTVPARDENWLVVSAQV